MAYSKDVTASNGSWLKALNLLENSSLGASAIFIPILASALTGSYILVGVIAAGYGISQAVSYAYFGRLADRDGSMIRLIRLGFLASSLVFFAHILAYDALTLLLIRLAAGAATGMYAGAMLALSHEKGNNGKLAGIVSFGSLGWLVGTVASGTVQQFTSSYTTVFMLAGSAFFAGFLVSLSLRADVPDAEGWSSSSSRSSSRRSGRSGDDGYSMLRSLLHVLRMNRRVYASLMLRHVGAAATWSIFPIFLKQELGLDGVGLGSVYALNSVTQFVFMNTVMKRVWTCEDTERLIQLGALLSSSVFIIYYVSSDYLSVVSAQILLGIAWSMLYLGSLYTLLNRSSEGEKATSTALLESTISISIIIGSLIGGMVAELTGLRGVMLVSFLLCLVSSMVALNGRYVMLKVNNNNNTLQRIGSYIHARLLKH